MYFINVVSKFKQKFVYKNLPSNIKAKFFKYYQWYVKRDFRWLFMFVVARFTIGRNLATFLKSDRASKIHDGNNAASIFKDLDINQVVASINEYGLFSGLQLPQKTLQEILEFAYSAEISVDDNPQLTFKFAEKKEAEVNYNQKILIGNYIDAYSKCLALKKLGDDANLIAIAAKYLGSDPILVRCQMGWCFTGEKEAYSQKGLIGDPLVLFHYDLDDYRALKFFFYLTDVDSLSGSHLCIAGSHKKRKLWHCISRCQSDKNIFNYYDSESIVSISGQAGFGFAEDPFCFHRGSPPVTSHRLMIQLEFALNDYGKWN